MKRLLIFLCLLTTLFSEGQTLPAGFTKINTSYQWLGGRFPNLLGVPMDTTLVPSALHPYSWLAVKDSVLWVWSISQNKYVAAISPALNIYTANGTLTGTRTINQNNLAISFTNVNAFNVTANLFGNHGSLQVGPSESRMDYATGLGTANMRLLDDGGGYPKVTYNVQDFSGKASAFSVWIDSIQFQPFRGRFIIDTLETSTDTTNFKPIGHNPITGHTARMPYWLGTGSSGFLGSNVSVGNAAEATFHDSVLWWKNDTTLIGRKFEFISADSKLSITYPAGSRNTDSTTSLLFTINPANILLSSLGGTLNLSQIAQGSATTGQVPMWNGSNWVPSSVSGSGSETDPISIHNQRAVQSSSFFNVNTGTFRDTAFFKGGAYITNYDAAGVNASWLVLPNGVSGIGFNGTGVDVVVGHAQFGGQFFTNTSAGDIAFRNTAADLDFGTGTGSGATTMKIVFASQTLQIAKAASTIIYDTTVGKPLVVNTSGQVIGRGYWYGPSGGGGGGSTPTLQQVSDAGSSTTTAITVQGMQLSTSSITNTTAAVTNLIGNNAGGVTFSFASTHKATIGQGLLTTDRGYDLPDATGTFALTNQTMPTGGTTGQVLAKIDGTNYNTQWVTPSGGGGGSPGGTDQQIQYNNAGAFGGSNLKYNNANGHWGLNTAPISTYVLDMAGDFHASGAVLAGTSATVNTTLFQSSVYSQATGSSPFFEYVNNWASNGSFRWKGAAGSTSLFELNGDQTIKAPGYAGTGTRLATFDASGVFGRGSIDPANIQQIATIATALTAAGTNQSTALALSGSYSIQEVTTTASGTGVKLPTASAASWIFVVNRGANDLVVYPNTSGVINGQSANVGFTVQAGSTSVFIGKDGTSWYTEQAYRGGDVANADGNKALNINSNVVTNAKLAQMAAHTYKGNNTGSTANAIDLTQTQLTAELNQFTSSLQGLVPSSGGGTTNFLRADGTWAAPPGGGGFSNPMTTLGDIIYGGTSGTATRLAGNTTTTKKILMSTGASGAATAPTWDDGSGAFILNQSASAQSSSSIYTSGAIKTDGQFTSTSTTAINFSTVGWAGYGANSVYIVENSTTLGDGIKMWINGGGDLGFFLDKDKSLTIPGVGLAADGTKIIAADATGKLIRQTIDPSAIVTTSASHAVTNAMSAQMAAHTFKGNNTGSTADAADLTQTQLTAELNAFVASGGSHAKGLVPDPGATAGTTKYLREDGTWVAPPGSITAASNVGSGVGVWYDINGGNTFRFKSLTTPTDGGITIADNGSAGIDLSNSGYDRYGKNRVTTSSTSVFTGKYFNPLPADCAGTITVEITGQKATGESFSTIRQINFKKVSSTCTLGTETILKANESLGSFTAPTIAWSVSANHPEVDITPPSSSTIYWNTTYKISLVINNL